MHSTRHHTVNRYVTCPPKLRSAATTRRLRISRCVAALFRALVHSHRTDWGQVAEQYLPRIGRTIAAHQISIQYSGTSPQSTESSATWIDSEDVAAYTPEWIAQHTIPVAYNNLPNLDQPSPAVRSLAQQFLAGGVTVASVGLKYDDYFVLVWAAQTGTHTWDDDALWLLALVADALIAAGIHARAEELRRQNEARYHLLSSYDSLTMLINRRRFQELVERVLQEIQLSHDYLALFYLDLDGFKKVNESLGHAAGDELLVQVAARIRNLLGEREQIARLGGDEFALALRYQADEHDDPAVIAQHIIDYVSQPYAIHNQRIYLGASIGIACAPRDGVQFAALLQHAYIAMEHAKTEGNRFQFFDPLLSVAAQKRLQIETDLRSAVTESQLTLHYQPIYSLHSNGLVAVESLVRWQHPQHGLLMPDRFVPIAEASGLIRDIDRFVIRAAMQQLRIWADSGYRFSVSVNLSVRTLHDPTLPAYVRGCLAETGAPPTQFAFEITESTAMNDVDLSRRILRELRELGFSIALDDFGSGHSSLRYLRILPIDYVKIDRAFVSGIGQNPYDEAVVRAVITLGEGLHVPVVAEGVNDERQIDVLRELGCAMIQGYGVGRPAPPDSLHLPRPHRPRHYSS